MEAKTRLLLVTLVLAVFVLQGCNGPQDGSREAPYTGSSGEPEDDADPVAGDLLVAQPPEPEGEKGPEEGPESGG